MDEFIKIRGAHEHNLQGIDIDIPKNKLVVITGLSGSGKSSLAFDTIYAEGQRRYMSSLSSHAKHYLGQIEKPAVDRIEGLPPTLAIDQKMVNKNPRSTVGTVTEIYDYLRILYARIGIPHCPTCGRTIGRQSVDQIVSEIMAMSEGTKIMVLAPVVRGKKGQHEKTLSFAKKNGYVRVRIDGCLYHLSEDIQLDMNMVHTIEIVIDRLTIKQGLESRIAESVENALCLTQDLVYVNIDGERDTSFSLSFSCPDCGFCMDEIEPRSFSFNSVYGACPECFGIGNKRKMAEELIIPDKNLSIEQGAIVACGWQSLTDKGVRYRKIVDNLSKNYHFDLHTPFNQYPEEIHDIIIYGTDYCKEKYGAKYHSYTYYFEGLLNNLEKRYQETGSDALRDEYESYMVLKECEFCHGMRLKPESLAVTIDGQNIYQLTTLPINKLQEFFTNLELSPTEKAISENLISEICMRIKFLVDIGLGYLSLSRTIGSLSGGEAQRVRLANQLGSGVVGVVYVLDEPSTGLHEKDNKKLIDMLQQLRDLGNSVIVVEHDANMMRAADFIVDVGPGAGENGGRIVASGTLNDITDNSSSLTGNYLKQSVCIPTPRNRRKPKGYLSIINACEHNLKNISVAVPLGVLCCITGVSGSGKSSLTNDILYNALASKLQRAKLIPGKHDRIDGVEQIDKVIAIDQTPIGRSPRSNAATYIGMFDLIRDLFAMTKDAKMKGFSKGRFSFNVKGGRCENCSGDGVMKIDMQFLPDVYVPCEVCKGKRFNRETLDVFYKGKNIFDVLNMTVQEAMSFFENNPAIFRKVKALYDVGLSYIKLSQTTLSGGEAQRIKLAGELSKISTGKTLYILDEPTTGLHFADVHKLTEIFQRLVEEGNTVLIIEHNMDIIKTADYIIDMGPEGGDHGGQVIAHGTPEEITTVPASFTGQYLADILNRPENL